jgi:septum formation protein
MTILLASQSPRRAELLRQIQVAFEIVSTEVDESVRPSEVAHAYVQRLAVEKSLAGCDAADGRPAAVVLGADTVVVVDGQILGKPIDRAHGLAQLALLSGRAHEVMTAVALHGRDFGANVSYGVRLCRSRVWFRALSSQQIEAYWATGECADKAGSYAIQGIAAQFVARLEGSYSGVMGLPLFETAQLLQGARRTSTIVS